MGTVTYRNGVAILQLIVFPFIFVAGLWVWKQTGWRVGSKVWRYAVILALLRVAGSICSLLTINYHSENIYVAEAVCELIGLAPLSLTYVGLLRLIDRDNKLPTIPMHLIPLACLVGLILAIIGVSNADFSTGFTPTTLMKAAMGLFLAVFVATIFITVWMFYDLTFVLRRYQKKLFMAIGLSAPFYTIRLVYSAIGDFSTISAFSYSGNTTVYLCMSVLEEIISMVITIFFGTLAVMEPDFGDSLPVPQEEPFYKPESV